MVRILEERLLDGRASYIEAVGLSTDEKPAGTLATGSTYIEIDTGTVYMFDEESGDWTEFGSQGGEDA